MTNLTTLETAVLKLIDDSEYGDFLCDSVWFWPSEMSAALKISAQAFGGVVTSLQDKGLVKVFIDRPRSDSTITMTEAGIVAYINQVGTTKKKSCDRNGEG